MPFCFFGNRAQLLKKLLRNLKSSTSMPCTEYFSLSLPYFRKEALINPFKNDVLYTNVESKLYHLESHHPLWSLLDKPPPYLAYNNSYKNK